jgi:transposase
MHLSDHSLRQLDEDYVRSLGTDELRGLSLKLLADLKEARDRLNQGPDTSSRPPSSRAVWEKGTRAVVESEEAEAVGEMPEDTSAGAAAESPESPAAAARGVPTRRKAGKQPGGGAGWDARRCWKPTKSSRTIRCVFRPN